jgi:hypothetical protein
MRSAKATKPTIRFTARLIRPKSTDSFEENELWTVMTLPKMAGAKLATPGATMIEATANGFPFRAALEPNGKGDYFLKVPEALQDATGSAAGDMVAVEITRVGEEPESRTPIDLLEALEAAPTARAIWEEITPNARRDWILWISSAKQEKTRASRIEKACDMLTSEKRRVCCFGGLNWLTKDHPKCGTWIPLPNSKHRSSPK